MSAATIRIEHVYEDVSTAELVTMLGEEAREEAAALGRKLSLTAELHKRRAQEYAEANFRFTDVPTAVAAEVSPIENISHSRALGQVRLAKALYERLPRVGELLRRGWIDYRMVYTIMTRTQNVDDEIIAELDEALAAKAEKWMKLSGPKLVDRVDMFVSNFDPEAVRVPRQVVDNRHVEMTPGEAGMVWISANLKAEDGVSMMSRLEALAATVCENDPRSHANRLADACGPLARLEATLPCQCGLDDCPAAAKRAEATAAVIHVLAEQKTLDGTSDKPGYLKGFGVLPAESVRQLAGRAIHKQVTVTGNSTTAETGYRPSAALRDFLQWRDLTCRWPGCDKPVERCDVDHTTPWPHGPTHPSNTKHYCRRHHQIKTFLCGKGGWSDRQLPDGTIELTAPTGHLWRTEAHGATLFPALGQSTGQLAIPPDIDPGTVKKMLTMPRRRRSREDELRDRIKAERRERAELIAEEERQRQAWLAANYEPPPF